MFFIELAKYLSDLFRKSRNSPIPTSIQQRYLLQKSFMKILVGMFVPISHCLQEGSSYGLYLAVGTDWNNLPKSIQTKAQ